MLVCSTKYLEVEGSGIGPVLPVQTVVFSYDRSFSFEVLLTRCAIFSIRERFCIHQGRI